MEKQKSRPNSASSPRFFLYPPRLIFFFKPLILLMFLYGRYRTRKVFFKLCNFSTTNIFKNTMTDIWRGQLGFSLEKIWVYLTVIQFE